jgi:hypothetical protein
MQKKIYREELPQELGPEPRHRHHDQVLDAEDLAHQVQLLQQLVYVVVGS